MMPRVIDAKNKRLGRLASEIAVLLQGKDKPGYNPRLLGGEPVVIKNVDRLVLTGNKKFAKKYYHHAGPLGHLKEIKFQDIFRKNPSWAVRHAVRLMLPKNRLSAKRMKLLLFE